MRASTSSVKVPRICLSFLLILFIASISSSQAELNYTDYCNSIVPEQITQTSIDFSTDPLFSLYDAHYSGGDKIFEQDSQKYKRSLSFNTVGNVYLTNVEGVYKSEATLVLRSSNMDYLSDFFYSSHSAFLRGTMMFRLSGIWSESLGKLCMVGSGSGYSSQGTLLNLDAILKLNYVNNPKFSSCLVSGTLESLSSADDLNYFEPISILAIPRMNGYDYTLFPKKPGKEFSGGIVDTPKSLSLGLQSSEGVCSMLPNWVNHFQLIFGEWCEGAGKNCNPFKGVADYRPQVMSLKKIQCSDDKRKLRLWLEFPRQAVVDSDYNYQPFDPTTTLVGEGLWDEEKNQLLVVACRILDATSFDNARIGDCSIRMTFRFPAIWSIEDRSSIVGQIWSNKNVCESSYFSRVYFQSSTDSAIGMRGLKYEYTKMEQVRELCPKNKPVGKKGDIFPDQYSNKLRFKMTLKNSKGNCGSGSAVPLSIGDHFYERDYESSWFENTELPAKTSHSSLPMIISYKISLSLSSGVDLAFGKLLSNFSSHFSSKIKISAEGIYNAESGALCMIGCKELDYFHYEHTNETMDCMILISLQFPPTNAKSAGYFRGSIKSSRSESDPLYFTQVDISSNFATRSARAKQSTWKIDMDITIILVSNTLSLVFAGFQIFYVKKHPEVLPFISFLMLIILGLAQTIPLVLNFDGLFTKNHYRRRVLNVKGSWLEMWGEVLVRAVTILAAILQLRLLQLNWSARTGECGNEKGLWTAEKRAFYVSLPLYMAGGLMAFIMHSSGFRDRRVTIVMKDLQNSLGISLTSYAGLVNDGFLLPQILFNLFSNSKKASLSHFFYIGTTIIRLLPHTYNLYKAQNDVTEFDDFYYGVNSNEDYQFSTLDVVIPCIGVLFAAIIFLQQLSAGSCFFCKKGGEHQDHEEGLLEKNIS
ncbi:Protein of unknown function DUF2921 [Dillenia turbinata]|uniref:RING-type E3 ubiquitin transferase n=1 Tax=Dillenia turbinata TaxID=194707 RepID=A0AAN8W7M1_9MAGN